MRLECCTIFMDLITLHCIAQNQLGKFDRAQSNVIYIRKENSPQSSFHIDTQILFVFRP